MLSLKLDTGRIHGSFVITVIVLSVFVPIVNIIPVNAQGSGNTLTVVARAEIKLYMF